MGLHNDFLAAETNARINELEEDNAWMRGKISDLEEEVAGLIQRNENQANYIKELQDKDKLHREVRDRAADLIENETIPQLERLSREHSLFLTWLYFLIQEYGENNNIVIHEDKGMDLPEEFKLLGNVIGTDVILTVVEVK